MFSVQVFYRSSGNPAVSKRVSVGFEGLFRGHTNSQFTDSNGECHFNCDNGTGTIYVNESNVYKGTIKGRTIVYV
ncbi:MAG: hypothetical protein LBG58_10100 [Planctomycetaceae bacterium]|nr:hypothetical protein [Planctomycetaceae bacterium]